MKFKYIGRSGKMIRDRVIKNGDIVDMPDNFNMVNFEPVDPDTSFKKHKLLKVKSKPSKAKKNRSKKTHIGGK